MKKLSTFLKTLLVAVGIGVGSNAWATDYLVENLTFENTETFADGWIKSNDPYLKQVTSGSNKFLLIAATGSVANADAARFPFSSLIREANEWKLEFDWNGYGSSNNNSSYLDVCNTAGTTIFRIFWKQYSDTDGNFGLQKLVGSSLSTFSTDVPYVHYSTDTRDNDTRAVPAYHFLLTADATNGVQLTVTKLSDASTVVTTTKIYDFFNLGSMYAYVYRWYAATSLDNIKAYVVADADPVVAPTLRYTKHGNAPVVTAGETFSGSTSKTYYCTAESATPATSGTLWTNNSSKLPSAGTYYFYTVSDDPTGGVSPATTYSYIDGIYENYDFEYWMNDDGDVDFTTDATSFKGHNLMDRIAFAGNWQTVNNGMNCGIRGTSQGNEMHFKNMTTSDKVILTFTGGYIRSYNSGNNFGYGKSQTDLTSGTIYSTDAGTNKLWDRNSTSGKFGIFTKVQVVTPTYTWYSAPSITIEGTNLTITPGQIRDTDGDAVITTYITTDGSDPYDNENDARLTSLTSLTSSSTIKVASYYDGVYSSVTEKYVEILNTPTITFDGMMEDGGLYYKKYTIAWSNTGMTGSPSVNLTATYNGTPVDITSGYYLPATNGTLIVTASADDCISSSSELSINADIYRCFSTPNFNEIPLANLSATIGGTWVDDGTSRWAYWSKTGGKNADLTSNGGESYAQYKLTSSGSVEVGSWFKFSRNRGSSNLSVLAGYGIGEYSYAPTMTINSPIEGSIIEYQNGTHSASITYATVTAEEESAGKWSVTFDKCQALRYCKYYQAATQILAAIADCKANETSAAFATAIDAEFFASSEDVYAFHTAWQIENASGNDITKVILDAAVTDNTHWNDARTQEENYYTGAPDHVYFDAWQDALTAKQTVYGLPAGTYTIKVATRASAAIDNIDNLNVYAWDGTNTTKVMGNHIGASGGYLAGNKGWSWTILLFTLSEKSNVEIGFYANPGAGLWASCDDWHLYNGQLTEPATLGTNGYGTFASPYPLDLAHLPEGLTAYKASTISGKTVTFTAVAEAVQANTGLLLKGDAGESETIVSIPVAASGADISETNQFLVNTAGTTFTGDDKYYYFGLKKNTLTFGLFNPSAVAIPANKAYLQVLKSSVGDSRSLSIVFDDDATAVFDLNDKSEMINDKWYDLQGRRVDGSRLTVNGSRLNPGIYIKNGRKVVVK